MTEKKKIIEEVKKEACIILINAGFSKSALVDALSISKLKACVWFRIYGGKN